MSFKHYYTMLKDILFFRQLLPFIFLLFYVNGFSFQLPANGSITNPCSEGEFYDLSASTCRPLCKPDLGFDINRFNQASSSTVYTLNQCTYTDLNNLLNSIGSQGGIVQLPACTITISGKIWLNENTILQGAGIGNTVIQAAPGYSGHMFEMRKIKNSVLRDLTIDGNGQHVLCAITWYCDNVLIERVEAKNSARTGIDFRYSKNVTIRYCSAHGAGAYHGIASKDCSNANPKPDHDDCSNEAGNTSPGVLWTTSYALYSNDTYNNGDHGFLSHALNGEIAGNRAANNGYGAKFFDGENVLIHHNKFEGNADYGTSINFSIDIPERLPRNLVFFENEYLNNGSQPFKISGWSTATNGYLDGITGIYLLNNYFAGNTPNEIRNVTKPGVLKICMGSQEDQLPYYGTSAVGYVTPGQCLDPCSVDDGNCLSVRLKLALEGALDDNGQYRSTMRTDLYSSRKLLPGQIPPPPAVPTPPGQPYSVAPWNYPGTEGLNFDQTTYENLETEYGAAPVDWVLVSFKRQAGDSGYIGRFSGVLLEDGTVILPEECMLPDSIEGSSYIMVEHLNHLPAMSTEVTFDGGYLLYDFTSSSGYSAGNLTTQLEIAPSFWALYAGDPDKLSDGLGFDINGNDKILWQSQNGFFDVYSSSDINRDGNIDGADKIIWNRNNGLFSILQK